ncbi:hypothetical protein VKT23_003513 [Stygiomarasmius scandens]|uniref:Uncharacterized protein n=1 Tax=Marasmiellus scandens TaxID=2682957 RepID=A0ABR1JXH5_9AGAR
MTSSSQNKPREPYSYIFRTIAYVLSLLLIPLNFAVLIWTKELEQSAGLARYTPYFASFLWIFVSTSTPVLCVDEFAKDRRLLPLMYAQFYAAIVFLRQYAVHIVRKEDGIVVHQEDIQWLFVIYVFTEIFYDCLVRGLGATEHDMATLRFCRLYRVYLFKAFVWLLSKVMVRLGVYDRVFTAETERETEILDEENRLL